MSSTAVQCNTLAPQRGAPISAELMARHEGLVRWVVRRQYLGELSFADALHEGRIGLWHALECYDPARGTAFSSYAVPAIRHAVWQAVAASRHDTEVITAHPSAQVVMFDPDELVHAGQLRAEIRAMVDRLPARLRLVIVDHYGLDRSERASFTSIGRSLSVSRQRAHQLHREALSYLAHPAHSLALRRLLGRHSRAHYQESLARHYQAARARRRQWRRER